MVSKDVSYSNDSCKNSKCSSPSAILFIIPLITTNTLQQYPYLYYISDMSLLVLKWWPIYNRLHYPLQLKTLVCLYHWTPECNLGMQEDRTQGAKIGASISATRYGMQQQQATTTTTTNTHADMPSTARCSNRCNLCEG